MKNVTNLNVALTYDNEFRWSYVLRALGHALFNTFLVAVYICMIEVLFYWLGDVPLGKHTTLNVWLLSLLAVFLFSLLAFRYFHRLRTGRYCIVGNNLIVHEQYFSSIVELTIPISSISDVCLTPYYKDVRPKWLFLSAWTPYHFIEITVEGQKYVLHCYAHADELYNELCKRIEKSINL